MALASVGLKTAIWNNNLRSLLLLVFYPVLIMGVVWVLCALGGAALYGSAGTMTAERAVALANRVLAEYWPTILAVVAGWFTVAFLFHGAMIRMLSGGKRVTRAEEPALYNMLENLCISRGLPVPRLEVVETDALNAFASGIGKNSYSITVTRGLLKSLKSDEIEAVLGHELTHIMNNDVRLLIISVIFTGMLGFASQMLWSTIRHMPYRSGRSRRNGGDGRLMLFLFAAAVILWIGYIATLFTRFALSRRREYMADAGSIDLTKNPEAMMRALMRISGHDRLPDAPGDIALMCIENRVPFLGLFATHPPIEDRIGTISSMTGTPVPDLRATTDKNPWA